jgi:hypothetical protein
MSTFSIMNNKKEEIIKSILKSHLKVDKNVFLSEKLFVAKSAVNWIFDNTKYPDVIKHYLKDVEKYLKGELLLSWSNGVLIKKKVKTNDITEKEKK